ncbi:MAG TPA: hypothetical protein VGB20_01560 [bacterium]
MERMPGSGAAAGLVVALAALTWPAPAGAGAVCDGEWREVPGGARASAAPVIIHVPAGARSRAAGTVAAVMCDADGLVRYQLYDLEDDAWGGAWISLDMRTDAAPHTYIGDSWDVLVHAPDDGFPVRRNVNAPGGWQGWTRESGSGIPWGEPTIAVDALRRPWEIRRDADGRVLTACHHPLPERAPASAAPLVLAFYYPWYGVPGDGSPEWVHWDPRLPTFGAAHTPVLGHHRSLGHYDSRDPLVIRQHLQWAKYAGIDGWIVSWWGPGSFDDRVLRTMVRAAEEAGVWLAVLIERQEPATREQLAKDLRYIADRYASSPSYLKLNGEPVVFLYSRVFTQGLTTLDARLAAEALRKQGLPVALFGESLKPEAARLFDGIFTYNPVHLPPAELRRIYQEAAAVADEAGALFAATVVPGFDTRGLAEPFGVTIERVGGRSYRDMWELALEMQPDWVLVTSFNEWHEGTEIEPSLQYGDQYLGITREFAEAFRARAALETDAPGAPACTIPLRLQPSGRLPAGTTSVTLSWAPIRDAALVGYSLRLDDGTDDRYDDPRFATCPDQPHYYCEDRIKDTSVDDVPVIPGRTYAFWVDPVYDPPRDYCAGSTTFAVHAGEAQPPTEEP